MRPVISLPIQLALAASFIALTGCASQQQTPVEPLQFPLERTQARMDRGQYLVSSLVLCLDCHSETDWAAPGAPFIPGTIGGGDIFPLEGLPGRVVASNISPDKQTGAGNWSDEDFFRAMVQGIGKDGRTLFPIMPYMNYREMSDEDLASIIVYVRSIDPVSKAQPKTELAEQARQSLKPLPPRDAIPPSDLSDPVKRGAYLVNAGLCFVCHTPPQPNGVPQPGMEFAGGWVMNGPWGSVATANITPDASGISYYDERMFVDMIHTGRVEGSRELNVLMPVRFYEHMTDTDLKAVFAYLKTLRPIAHRVDNTEPPATCKLCGFSHGLGAMN